MCWDWESPRLYQPAGMCRQLPARHSWILLWPPSARAGTSQAGRYNSARSAGLHNHHAQARPGAAEPHWAPGPGQPDSESGAGPGRPRAARRYGGPRPGSPPRCHWHVAAVQLSLGPWLCSESEFRVHLEPLVMLYNTRAHRDPRALS